MFFLLLQCPITRTSWCSSYNTPQLAFPRHQRGSGEVLYDSITLYFSFTHGALPLRHSLNKLTGVPLPTRCFMWSHWSQRNRTREVASPFYSDSQHWRNVPRILVCLLGLPKRNDRLVAYTADVYFLIAPEARSQGQGFVSWTFLACRSLPSPSVLIWFFLCAKSLSVWASKFPLLRTPVGLINLP